jgi:signal peptidase I
VTGLIWTIALCAGLTVLLGVARRLLLVVTVNGPSMEPALAPGDRMLVIRGGQFVRVGRVVVLRPVDSQRGERPYLQVKRVAAVSGDPVPESVRGVVNAVPGDLVPHGKLVVLGDAPSSSADSRHWGFTTVDNVVGVMATRWA